ncbi:MAG: hypothetical protein ACFE9C_11140 [Candidatus Hodarchaeota archaeon]
MPEQDFIQERDKIAQEIDLELKIGKILEENKGIAFTIGNLNDQLEELIDNADQLEFAKGNLLEFLDIMKDEGKIDIIQSGEETHYIFKRPVYEEPIQEKVVPEKIVQEKTLERPKASTRRTITYDSINQSITFNYIQVTKGVLLVGLLLGLLSMTRYFGGSTFQNLFEILNLLGIIFIVISFIIEGVIASQQSKENRAYDRPTYGLVALVCDIIGIIILNYISSGYPYYYSNVLYAVLFFIVAVLSGLGGLYGQKDSRPFAATVGLFFGMTFFIMHLYPFILFIIYYV